MPLNRNLNTCNCSLWKSRIVVRLICTAKFRHNKKGDFWLIHEGWFAHLLQPCASVALALVVGFTLFIGIIPVFKYILNAAARQQAPAFVCIFSLLQILVMRICNFQSSKYCISFLKAGDAWFNLLTLQITLSNTPGCLKDLLLYRFRKADVPEVSLCEDF